MDRTPGRHWTIGRAAIDPNRVHPFGGLHEMSEHAPTADKTGIYELADGTPVRIKAGEWLPDGATYRDDGNDSPVSERTADKAAIDERAKGKAAENRAKPAAPENRSA